MVNQIISNIITIIENVLYYPLFQTESFSGIPFLALWIFCASIFFTFRLKFVNLRLFTHGVKVMMGKFSSPNDVGEVSPFQAMTTMIAATVGIGNIAGVAVAITIGGPGAVLWMVIMGFFGMSVIFSEVLLAQKYRKIDKDGTISGGPFYYLKLGLEEINMPRTGKILAMTFAIFCLAGALGVSMFQTNQATSIITTNIEIFQNNGTIISIVIAIITALVLIGGIKRIASITEFMVPFMAILYIAGCLTVLFVNFDKIDEAVSLIFSEAFNISAVGGGFLGALIAGIKRAMFSNEAGLGTSPIANAAAKSAYPARQASASALSPFIDTIVICFLSGVTIITTGAHEVESLEGVQVVSFAFNSVSSWFPYVLILVIFLFAYSSVITYGYYAANAWRHIFGKKALVTYYVIYCGAIALSGGLINFDTIVRVTDSLTLAMCLPNLAGLYLLHKIVEKEMTSYTIKLKQGDFTKNKKGNFLKT